MTFLGQIELKIHNLPHFEVVHNKSPLIEVKISKCGYWHAVVLTWAIKHSYFQKLAGLWLAGEVVKSRWDLWI